MDNVVEKEYSKEELKALQENLSKHCDEQLPLLRKQAELAELQFKVDNFFLNRRLVRQKLAELDASQKEAVEPKP